jgi:hypothetical protein
MADDTKKQDEGVKKLMEETKARTEETRKQGAERLSKGKPTPTQEEVDRAALGEHVAEKEDDGSGPEPHTLQARQMEGDRPSGYSTRQAQASQSASKPTPPRPAQPPHRPE